MREFKPVNRELIDLRDKRTDLAIRISLLQDTGKPDEAALYRLQRELEVIDRRIAGF
jgi:hypothetical protein